MPKFSRRPDDRPDEILEAALKCFVDKGFADTRMEEIGAAAGVTAGTIYRYFPSKAALIEALVERYADLEWSRGRELAAAYGSSTARQILLVLLGRWADHLEAGPASSLLTLIVRESARFEAARSKYVSLLLAPGCIAIARVLRHGIERGEFALMEIEATAQSLALTVVGGALWRATLAAALPPLPPGVDPARLAIASAVRGIPAPSQEPLAVPPRSTGIEAAPVSRPLGAPGLRIVTLRPPEPH